MKKRREFNNILDECLERTLVKGETIEQCIQNYPEHAAKLEPLLQTALATKKASAIQPRPEFRAKASYQFHSALQAMEPKRRLSFLGWQSRWATVVTAVLILMLVGGSTVAAAGNSMPDDPLYPVKLATEQARLTLTPSASGKAELYAKLADNRVTEIVYMANKGETEQMERVTQRLESHLTKVAVLTAPQKEEADALLAPAPPPAPAPSGETKGARVRASNRAKLKVIVARQAINHPAALRAVLKTAPESAKPALHKAISASEAGYKKILESLD